MDVLVGQERLDQPVIPGDVGEHPQLDLRVVGRHEPRVIEVCRHERAPDVPSRVGANRDVLQVRVGAAQPPRRGDRLLEIGVDAPVFSDRSGQSVGVR